MSEANKKAYTRTEGEYEALERQLAEAREENNKLKQCLAEIRNRKGKSVLNGMNEQLKELGE